MNPYDPFSQQGPGFPGAPAGPLGDIQNQIASVLNGNGNPNTIYVPGAPGEPVFPVPNVRALLVTVFRFFSRRGN